MDRVLMKAIVKLCAEAVLFTAAAVVVIGMIGYAREWDSSIAYSNAFFVAGCLFIIAGGLSRGAAGEERNTFQLFSGEAFRGMSRSEQANYIIHTSTSTRFVILGLLTGILLILLSVIAAYLL